MSENAAIEERLNAVERDLAELKDHVFRSQRAGPWFEKMIGSMKDYPEFEMIGSMKDYPEFAEVVKLGREIRKSDAAL